MKKRVLYIVIAVVTILFLFLVYLLLQNSAKQQQATNSQGGKTTSTVTPKVTPGQSYENQPTSAPGQALAPEQVVGYFYTWYMNYPGVSALTSGDYKTSPYLSDSFKKVITQFAPYSSQNDPVFCQENKVKDFAVQSAQVTPNGQTKVNILDVKSGRILYSVVLSQIDQEWLIVDTVCIP